LRFDRFTLDLTRGSLQLDEQDVYLRPKAFDVLCYLVENAGRLVSKPELYQAIWPNVVVSDDSLVQCIGELRQKLGDDEHRLIKTMSRRGYLLDASVSAPFVQDVGSSLRAEAKAPSTTGTQLNTTPRSGDLRNWRFWCAASVAFLCVLVGTAYVIDPLARTQATQHTEERDLSVANVYPAPLRPSPPGGLFTASDAKRVAELADKKHLPVPAFEIRTPDHDVSEAARRFVGVWVSDTGWINSSRQFMLIVTSVTKDGAASGYAVNGPSQPMSLVPGPSFSQPLKGRVSGNTLSQIGKRSYVASLTAQNHIEFRMTFEDGTLAMVALDPVWTLVESERQKLSLGR
jgi:DNA-binding winged helix-turn-helix (wHTH) protein